jgi:hypothetical protein
LLIADVALQRAQVDVPGTGAVLGVAGDQPDAQVGPRRGRELREGEHLAPVGAPDDRRSSCRFVLDRAERSACGARVAIGGQAIATV